MKKLITATGKEFDIRWEAVSTIDGALRFGVAPGQTMDKIHNTFKKPAETQTLTRVLDGVEKVYTGFTGYRGFDRQPDGEIVVSLDPA